MRYLLGVDVGGTFTDFVAYDPSARETRTWKVPTVPSDPVAGILEGITRNLVMDLARKRGIPVFEKLLIRHDLYVADECFATGTAAEIISVVNIDRRPVGDGKPGPITKQLTEDFVAYRNAQ